MKTVLPYVNNSKGALNFIITWWPLNFSYEKKKKEKGKIKFVKYINGF
jgi:hypothetical protein